MTKNSQSSLTGKIKLRLKYKHKVCRHRNFTQKVFCGKISLYLAKLKLQEINAD